LVSEFQAPIEFGCRPMAFVGCWYRVPVMPGSADRGTMPSIMHLR
jgi:hypothetical protein